MLQCLIVYFLEKCFSLHSPISCSAASNGYWTIAKRLIYFVCFSVCQISDSNIQKFSFFGFPKIWDLDWKFRFNKWVFPQETAISRMASFANLSNLYANFSIEFESKIFECFKIKLSPFIILNHNKSWHCTTNLSSNNPLQWETSLSWCFYDSPFTLILS